MTWHLRFEPQVGRHRRIHSRPHLQNLTLFKTESVKYYSNRNLTRRGFKPRTSVVGSNYSVHCATATTAAHFYRVFVLIIKKSQKFNRRCSQRRPNEEPLVRHRPYGAVQDARHELTAKFLPQRASTDPEYQNTEPTIPAR